jgi:hypothetical protein
MSKGTTRSKGLSRFAKPALAVSLTVGAFAAVAVGVDAGTPAHAHFEPDSSLMVSTRDELRVCVDTHGELGGGLDQALSAAVGTVRRHPQWGTARYGDTVPLLERGCATTLPSTGVTKGVVVGPGVTADPSPYRTVIVVLDEANAKRYLGDQPAVLVPYELMKLDDHVAVTVTQAVVARGSVVGTPAFANEYLTPALGLEPVS